MTARASRMPRLTLEQAARIKLEADKEELFRAISPAIGPDGRPDQAPFLRFLSIVQTKDEKDEGKVKLFPSDKEYLLDLAARFVQEPLLLVKKSRQMMVSWLAVAYCAWRCYTRPNQLIIWQSKTEGDAAAMVFDKDDPQVARMSFICSKLPRWAFDTPKGSYASLLWPNGSIVKGAKQNPEMVRQLSPSLVLSDEMGFQEYAGEIYAAARPAISGGGQFIGISSANPGFFWEAAEDRYEAAA